MYGVSEVIAIILILMITISLAGLAYMFMSTTMSDVTASVGSTVDTTTSSMLTSFTIESINQNHIYIRNTGQNALTSLSVYVNDIQSQYVNVSPSSVSPGQVGTITVYDMPGGTVKVTSPSGFSATKTVTDRCLDAIACWRFEENNGTAVYDSSRNGNNGTISGAAWTNGKLGNGLLLDGTNDYVNVGNSFALNSSNYTWAVWVKFNSISGIQNIMHKSGRYIGITGGTTLRSGTVVGGNWRYADYVFGSNLVTGVWYHISGGYNGTHQFLYFNGALVANLPFTGSVNVYSINDLNIGRENSGLYYFSGVIDEFAIWNRELSSSEILELYNMAS